MGKLGEDALREWRVAGQTLAAKHPEMLQDLLLLGEVVAENFTSVKYRVDTTPDIFIVVKYEPMNELEFANLLRRQADVMRERSEKAEKPFLADKYARAAEMYDERADELERNAR